MKFGGLVGIFLLSVSAAACGGPVRVRTLKSPDPTIYLTIETQGEPGLVPPDSSTVYVHFSQKDGSTKQILLSGEYLENVDLSWRAPDTLRVCLRGGYTAEFHNDVMLEVGQKFKRIRAYMDEQCSIANWKING